MKRIVLLLFLWSSSADAVSLTFWSASTLNEADSGHWAPFSGHWLQNGGAIFPQLSAELVPAGTLVHFGCEINAPFVGDDVVVTVYRNFIATAATCTAAAGAFFCDWNGSMTISEDDTLNYKIDKGPGIGKSPYSCMATLQLSPPQGLDWPFTS